MSDNVREIVIDTLLAHEQNGSKSHLLIREVLDKYDYLDARDKSFFKRVAEGTISSRLTLDFVLNQILDKKDVTKLKPVVRALLRMSAYQIIYMDKIPDNAVCDEAVKLCRKRSFEEFTPFVNGVLRKLCKDKARLTDFDNIEDKVLRLSVKYSMPDNLVRMFIKEVKDPEGLLKSFNEAKPTSVRILASDDVDELTKAWINAGVNVVKSKHIDNAFLLDGYEGAMSLEGFWDGKFIIQDESSMLAAKAAGVKAGEKLTVIDVCAAPGGKSLSIASQMHPDGEVLSFDVSDLKVDLIRENVKRLRLDNVIPMVGDATVFNPELVEKADVLICDLPCSGLGVIGRKSDIKYNVSNEGMKELCDLQKKIIDTVWQYVKPGGVMLYSTCTIHKAENEKMYKYITANYPFEGDSLKDIVPSLFDIERENEAYIQLLPNVDDTDGFFICRLRRKS